MQAGKLIIFIGLAIVVIGLIISLFGSKLGWIGNLPGDIRIERENFKMYIPITTMILFSVLGSIVLRLVQKYL